MRPAYNAGGSGAYRPVPGITQAYTYAHNARRKTGGKMMTANKYQQQALRTAGTNRDGTCSNVARYTLVDGDNT